MSKHRETCRCKTCINRIRLFWVCTYAVAVIVGILGGLHADGVW